MRQHLNQVFKDGQVVEQSVVDWTVDDYNQAIRSANSPIELFELTNERAVLLGLEAMTARIDEVADAKRMQFLGDVTRAFEYTEAEKAAKEFEAAGFDGPVPEDVMSWAIASNITPRKAAEDIIREAGLFSDARIAIRALRLKGKQTVKNATTAEQAIEAYMTAIATINGIGK